MLSTQHSPTVTHDTIREDLIERIIDKVIPDEMMDKNTKIYVNPTGRFVTGGPHGDAGVTGRKIIVDTYGGCGAARRRRVLGQGSDEGGPFGLLHGALHRQERGGRGPGRQRAGAARVRDRRGGSGVDAGGHLRHGRVADEKIVELVRAHFQLTPRGIIESLDLRRPIYRKTAAFGHFGRTEPEFTWERTDKAAALRAAAGI